MKLHEYKRKWMWHLATYEPQNGREREIRETLIIKLNNLRVMTIPNFIFTLYQVIEHENITEPFKKILKEMLEETELIEEED